VVQGIATLTGVVDSNAIKQAAARAAEHIEGIRSVANALQVQPGAASARKDTQLATAVADSLAWSSLLRGHHIMSRIEHGWVVLEGSVPSAFQRIEAERIVQGLHGVHGITNLLEVSQAVEPDVTIARLRSALQRQTQNEGTLLEIIQLPAGLLLRGQVRSHQERQHIEETARHAGAIVILNQLEIGAPGTT
jgi:osmotically-inducible protein OsmY